MAENIPLNNLDVLAEIQTQQEANQQQQQQSHGGTPLLLVSHAHPAEVVTTTPRNQPRHNQDVVPLFREALSTGQNRYIVEHLQAKRPFDLTAILDPLEGENLLMLACRHGRTEIVEELMKLEQFITLCKRGNKDRKTPLIIAAEMAHVPVVRLIAEFFSEKKDDVINLQDSGGFSALMWACYKGLFEVADVLVRIGRANVNIRADNAMTCLMWAAGRGHEEVCKLLVQNSASVNMIDKFGSTAFFWSCRHNRINVARYLLQHGANPDIAGMNGKTPLMLAAKTGNIELTSVILTFSNANVNMVDGDGCTPLMMASKEGHLEVVNLLVHASASVNMCDKKNDSVLIYAVRAGKLDVVRKLCEGRIDINHQGQDGKTALYCAVEKQFQDIAALLLSFRADVEITAADKSTPLLKAVKLKNANIVELLLNSNAKLTPTDKNGDTVLHIALRQKSRKIVQLLLRNPRNARLLYKPNKHNITPYSIDEGQEQPILPQIFGTTNLNRAEHGQSLVGYELYSSSLAVMLSEPTLCTPLTVGLYARWGSGKSFVVSQLKDYLSQYQLQEGIVLFRFSALVIFLCCLFSAIVGLIFTMSIQRDLWFIGIIISLSTLIVLILSLLAVWWCSRHRAAKWIIDTSQKLESFMRRLSIITNVIFANPLSTAQYLQQLRFIVVNCPKFSGNVRPGGIIRAVLAEMYLQVEAAYGSLTSRLLLIFQPNETTHRSHRFFCCLPLYVWGIIWSISTYLDCILIYAFWPPFATWRGVQVVDVEQDTTASVFIVIFSAFSALGILLFFFAVVCRFWYLSVRPPYQQLLASETANSVLTEEALGRLVKHHINLLARCVHAIDAFACTQTRFLVILDELDTYDQANVVHMLDVVHRYFASESRAPFINVLVLDPHIIIKHLDAHLASSNYEGVQMTGHDYLRSVVHLPIFLQAQPSITLRQQSPPEAALQPHQGPDLKPRLGNRPRPTNPQKQADTVSIKSAVSVATNKPARASSFLPPDESGNLMPTIPTQMTIAIKTGLSELIGSMSAEYFSDVNPRTLTRVTNICAFMARLLHASGVPFNWYNLTAWVNLTEQWPYHLSWILVHIENNSNAQNYDLKTPISTIYVSVRRLMPGNDPMRFMDKSPLKLEAALSSSNPLLTLHDVLTFLRFTVNLDPYLRRIVREHANQSRILQQHQQQPQVAGHVSPSRQVSISTKPFPRPQPRFTKSLGMMNVEDVCEFMSKIAHMSKSNIDRYREALQENNICGPVLTLCNLDELRQAIPMTFGDWQLFVAAVNSLRSAESSAFMDHIDHSSVQLSDSQTNVNQIVPMPGLSRPPSDTVQNVPPKEVPKSVLTLSVPSSIAEVHDSYVTPDSAADAKTPIQSYDVESVVGELLAVTTTANNGNNNQDPLQPSITSSASASAIQNIEAALLRRAVSGMTYEEDLNDEEQEATTKAEFSLGQDEIIGPVASSNDVIDLVDSARSSTYTMPGSPVMSELGNYQGRRINADGSPAHSKTGTIFKVTKSTLSPVPSAVFAKNNINISPNKSDRTDSESSNRDDASSSDGHTLRVEQQPLLAD